MKYNSKIKDKNAKGFIIDGLAFLTLRDAEEYCDKKNVDPDEIRHSDTPEFKEELHNIAMVQKVVLCNIKDKLNDMLEKQCEHFEHLCKEEENCHPLDKDFYHDELVKQMGVTSGVHMALSTVFRSLMQLEELTQYKSNSI